MKTERERVIDGRSEKSNGGAERIKGGGESDKEVFGGSYDDVERRGQ